MLGNREEKREEVSKRKIGRGRRELRGAEEGGAHHRWARVVFVLRAAASSFAPVGPMALLSRLPSTHSPRRQSSECVHTQ